MLVYAFVVSGIIGFVVHKTMGFRIDEEHEVSGIDLVRPRRDGLRPARHQPEPVSDPGPGS